MVSGDSNNGKHVTLINKKNKIMLSKKAVEISKGLGQSVADSYFEGQIQI